MFLLQLVHVIHEDHMCPILDLLRAAAISQDKNYQGLAIHIAPSLSPFIEESTCPTHCADYIFSEGQDFTSESHL